jgi:outer membrane protein
VLGKRVNRSADSAFTASGSGLLPKYPMHIDEVSMMRALLTVLFVAFTLLSTGHAAEQQQPRQPKGAPNVTAMGPLGWRTELGAGFIANPRFVGSDEFNTTAIPYFDVRYIDAKGTKFFANVPQGLGAFFSRRVNPETGSFMNFAVALAPGFNVRDDSIPGLEEVGIATEARLFGEIGTRRWSGSATLAQDLGTGHDGAYLDVRASYRNRFMDNRAFYSVGPVLRFGNATYKNSLFGISPEDSAQTGLPAYDPDGGLERVGLQGIVSLPLGKSKWRSTTSLRMNRLIDNAANSPIVVDRNQYFFLTSITRAF